MSPASSPQSDFVRLRCEAARVGITLPETVQPMPRMGCCGHQLPEPFIWFCRHYPGHVGFPHHGWEAPFGLLTPFGNDSALHRRNHEVRQANPKWPAHWVSFWYGNDGDYCFSFDQTGHAWVVYWDYNSGFSDESEKLYFADDYVATDFVDWIAEQVGWVLKQQR